MKNSFSAIHIAIAFDKGYVTPVHVFLASLFANVSNSSVIIHAIATGISEEERELLQKYSSENDAKIIFYVLNSQLIIDFPLPNRPGAYITLATYYRLFFPALLDKEISRLIYLDVDTLIVGDLSKLYNYPMDGNVIAAVQEIEMESRLDIGFLSMADYFNAGVLLIDLAKWREQDITGQALAIIAAYGEKLRYHDQDTLNLVFRGKWQRLPEGFNLMKAYIPHDLPRRYYAKYLADKVVVHYNGALKPWHRACENRFRYLYPYYLKKSPYANQNQYVQRTMSYKEVNQLLFSRSLELYFNYPAVGQTWRRIKRLLRRY